MTWIQTYTGRKFDLAHPAAVDVDPVDITHALSLLCRFTGHVRDFYSVAQHCVIVSELVPPEHALTGLLHDATEAYVADMSSPLKRMLPEYRAIEDRVWWAIADRFGLPDRLPGEVIHADRVSLMWERRDLLGSHPEPWGPELEALVADVPAGLLVAWGPREAEFAFETRLRSLMRAES